MTVILVHVVLFRIYLLTSLNIEQWLFILKDYLINTKQKSISFKQCDNVFLIAK